MLHMIDCKIMHGMEKVDSLEKSLSNVMFQLWNALHRKAHLAPSLFFFEFNEETLLL